MEFYVDTSAIVGLYLAETHSAAVRELITNLDAPVPLTHLHYLELRNTIRRAVFQRRITIAEMGKLQSHIVSHEQQGVFKAVMLAWPDVFFRADAISTSCTPTQGGRALDILHIASALALGAREFITFDHEQAVLARSVGLKVRPRI